jgi:hypothetical protein
MLPILQAGLSRRAGGAAHNDNDDGRTKEMEKIDVKKELAEFYNSSAREFKIVDVPALNFLMVDGAGDPNIAQEYKEAVEALYSVAYTLKFMVKKGSQAIDYGVMPLEGLWWADDMSVFTTTTKDKWKWTAMIMQPRFIDSAMFEEARQQAAKRKSLPAVPMMRFESFREGPAAQILYFGPYSGEGPTIQRLHEFIWEKGYEMAGRHHEIYLGDPGRTAPEKLKTIIRQPMK